MHNALVVIVSIIITNLKCYKPSTVSLWHATFPRLPTSLRAGRIYGSIRQWRYRRNESAHTVGNFCPCLPKVVDKGVGSIEGSRPLAGRKTRT
jgi:hypothetical protein